MGQQMKQIRKKICKTKMKYLKKFNESKVLVESMMKKKNGYLI
jgi:hypothetical protein